MGESFVTDLKGIEIDDDIITRIVGAHQKNYEMQYLNNVLLTETERESFSRVTVVTEGGVADRVENSDDNDVETGDESGDENEKSDKLEVD